jgi:hypothetical protein
MSDTMAKNSKILTISLNHHICPIIFNAEKKLSKLQFNIVHFIGPILILRGPASFMFYKDKAETLRYISVVMIALDRTIDPALLFQHFLVILKSGDLFLKRF